MTNYDEELQYAEGGDTGEGTGDSIQPILDTERIYAVTLDRPDGNLQQRSEIIRTAIKQLKYESDYQRGALTLSSLGQFALTHYSTGPDLYGFTSTAELRIIPALVPNAGQSGGRQVNPPFTVPASVQLSGARVFVGSNSYIGVLGTNDLWVFADPNLTGQRGYSDGTDMNVLSTFSVGANNIDFTLAVNTGLSAGTVSILPVTGSPTRHISVQYGPSTTIGQLVTAINGDHAGGSTQSQGGGTWGIGEMIHVATTNPSGTTALVGGNEISCTSVQLQGSYDAEMHVVTEAQFAAFFGVTANQLREGETLVLAYPAGPVQDGGSGGRRQSLIDFPSTRLGAAGDNTGRLAGGAGFLVNGGLHPEQIPGAIPIGRLTQGRFVFIDGTVLIPGGTINTPGTALYLSQSAYDLADLASTSPAGALLVGFTGTESWNADLTTPPEELASVTVNAAINEIVGDLADQSTNVGGSRLIGSELSSGSSNAPATVGNSTFDLTAGSIREQLVILQADAVGRVKETGHMLHGASPIQKNFLLDTSFGGGVAFQEILNPIPNVFATTSGKLDFANVMLQPVTYTASTFGSGGALLLTEPVSYGGSPSTVLLTNHAVGSKGVTLEQYLPTGVNAQMTVNSTPVSPVMVQIVGATGGVNNSGYYLLNGTGSAGFVGSTGIFTLMQLNGSACDFSSTNFTGATITVYNTLVKGNDAAGNRVYGHQGGNGGASMVFLSLASSAIPLLTVYDNTSYALATGASVVVTPAHARFLIGQTVNGHSATRDTNNILIQVDHDLLNGQETGTPVDATLSHNHGATYSLLKVTPFSGTTTIAATIALNGSVAGTYTQTILSATQVAAGIDASHKIKALILNLFVTVVSSSSMAEAQHMDITFSSGVGGSSTHTLRAWYIQTSSSAITTYFNEQIMVDVTVGSNGPPPDVSFTITLTNPGTLFAAGSQMVVTGVGAYLDHL
jgi:hypothetical protein